MKTLILIVLINTFASISLAQEEPCSRNNREFNHGEIITGESGRRYRCKNGRWKIIQDENIPVNNNPQTSPQNIPVNNNPQTSPQNIPVNNNSQTDNLIERLMHLFK